MSHFGNIHYEKNYVFNGKVRNISETVAKTATVLGNNYISLLLSKLLLLQKFENKNLKSVNLSLRTDLSKTASTQNIFYYLKLILQQCCLALKSH